MILQVVIKQVRRDEAPIICEKLLQIMSQQLNKQKEMMVDTAVTAATTTTSINNSTRVQREMKLYEPNIYSYNILLKAWVESRLDEASDKVKSLLQEMKDVHDIELGLVSYKILLRFYSRLGDVDHVNIMLQEMHTKRLPIDVDCLTQALNCCCRAGQLDNAHTILNMMIHQHPNNAERTRAIQESIHHLVLAYRNRLDAALLLAEKSVLRKAGDDDYHNTRQEDNISTSSSSSLPPINSFLDDTKNDGDDDDNNNNNNANTNNAIEQQPEQQRPDVSEVIQNTIQRLQDLTNIIKTMNVLDQQSLGKKSTCDHTIHC